MPPSLCFLLILLSLPLASSTLSVPQPGYKYDDQLARLALEYAAASYADDPWPCLKKNNASLVTQVNVPCDALRDKCWAIVVDAPEHIIIAFQGTASRTQLITELIESISSPKHNIPGIGSVQRYFFVALAAITEHIREKVEKLREEYPTKPVVYTGHSLGGALASLAAVQFANATEIDPSMIHLYTFGQPRVGNFEYSQSVDRLVPNTWRIVHKYDLVSHVPYCVGLRTCRDFLNHSPYHHGTEVWYPDDMGSRNLYKVCDGQPLDEDASCSNGHLLYTIDDHLHYFDVHVSDYGIDGCARPDASLTSLRAKKLSKKNLAKKKKRYRNHSSQSVSDIPEFTAIALITDAAVGRWARDYTEYLWDWWHRHTNGTLPDEENRSGGPFRPSWS